MQVQGCKWVSFSTTRQYMEFRYQFLVSTANSIGRECEEQKGGIGCTVSEQVVEG